MSAQQCQRKRPALPPPEELKDIKDKEVVANFKQEELDINKEPASQNEEDDPKAE